ncbi:MAG: sensor histidine kinase [Longimicrobiales bacterium]
MRSFRTMLALRVAGGITAGVIAISVLSYLALREALDRELDASLINVASIQASSLTEDPTGVMRFHEWELTPEEAASVRDLNRFAQVWNGEGESLLRTQYITTDLPLDEEALEAAIRGELAWTEGRFQGIPIRSLFYPLERLGELHTRHVLQVAAPLESRDRMLATVALFLLGLSLSAGVASFVAGWWLASRMVHPVDDIIDQAESIGVDRGRRIIEAYADTREYQRLVQVLNGMLTRLDAALEAQRRFTADASHELRSPLTALRGELEVARRRERSKEEYARVLDSALDEVERLSRIAEDLLTLTRSEAGVVSPQKEMVDLRTRIVPTLERLGRTAKEKGVRVELLPGDAVTALVDPDLLDRVVWNLVDNAIKFTPPGGEVEARICVEGGHAVLEIRDTGPGIPPDRIPQIFERFVRLDDSRTPGEREGGTGLGLAIVRAISDLHGGRVEAGNRTGGGAVFRVFLSLMKEPS